MATTAQQPGILLDGSTRHPRGGMGWLLAIALFACMALLPFAIAALVLLGS